MGEERPYRLLVEREVALESDRYKAILGPLEVASGTLVTVRFHVTNLGPLPFPGGTLTIETQEYGFSGTSLATQTGGAALPPLSPQQRQLAYEGKHIFPLPGLAWLTATAEAPGSAPVLLCKREADEGSPRAGFMVVVVSRIELETLLALQGKGRE